MPDLPTRIGPAEFGELGRWVTVRCRRELAPLVKAAGGHDLDQLPDSGESVR